MAVEDRIRELVAAGSGRAPIALVLKDALGVSGAAGPLARTLVESAVRGAAGLAIEGDDVIACATAPATLPLAALAVGRGASASSLPSSAAFTALPAGALTVARLEGAACCPGVSRLARSLAGTRVLTLHAAPVRRMLRLGSVIAGLDGDAEPRVVSLARVARHVLGRPLKDVEDAAALVGAPVPEELEGSCLLVAALAERLAEISGVELAELPSVADRDVPEFDFGARAFRREHVVALPEGPGVYLFEDEAGSVLYVGKAQDLRQRVSSYFGPSADERARRIRDAAHGLSFERTGSELSALLREQELIRDLAPALNVHESVHPVAERAPPVRGFTGALGVVIPSAEGGVEVVLVDPLRGVVVAQVVAEERESSLATLRSIVDELRSRTTSPRAHDAEVGMRWLAGRGETASLVVADGAIEALVEALMRAVEDPDLGRTRILAPG